MPAPVRTTVADSPSSDALVDDPCGPYALTCGTSCVSQKTDPDNCGSCGPPIDVTDGTTTDCAGNVAGVTLRWAVCSCGDIGQLSSTFKTDGYDTSVGPYVPGGLGASVGANGRFRSGSPVDVGGTLWTAGSQGLTASSPLIVRQELHVGGPWSMSSTGTVSEDAFIAGNITATQPTTIGKTLYKPANATITGPVTATAVVDQAVSIAPPCDCASSQLINVAGIVAQHATNNGNAAIGLDPDVFEGTNVPTGQRLDLPCGHYYLSKITTSIPVTIAVHGHTALYIGGDITNGSELTITLDATSTLDVFIGGGICNSQTLTLGSPNYPAQMRVYVGGTNACQQAGTSVRLNSPVNFATNIYAPYGKYVSSTSIRHYGAVFAGEFNTGSETEIHYDRAVLDAHDECPPPPTSCGTCQDCNNQACVNGMCGACQSSADCCAPLVCDMGVCVPVVLL